MNEHPQLEEIYNRLREQEGSSSLPEDAMEQPGHTEPGPSTTLGGGSVSAAPVGSDLSRRNDELVERLKLAEERNEKLTAELAEERRQRETSDHEVARAANEREAIARDAAQLRAQLQGAEEASRRADDIELRADSAEAQLADHRSHLERMKDELEKDRIEIASLTAENAAATDQLSRANADRDEALRLWQQATDELAVAVDERDDLRRSASSASNGVGDGRLLTGTGSEALAEGYELLTGGRQIDSRDALAAVDALLRVAPDQQRLLEHRGIILAKLGRHAEAISVLQSLASLDSEGASALVISSLRETTLPPQSVVLSVDWSGAATIAEALEASRRLPVPAALAFGIQLAELLPIDQSSRYFEAVAGRRLSPSQFEQLFEIWVHVDPMQASTELMRLVESKRVSSRAAWVEAAMRATVLESGTRRARTQAVIELARVMGERGDSIALLELADDIAFKLDGQDAETAVRTIVSVAATSADPAHAVTVVDWVIESCSRGATDPQFALGLVQPLERWLPASTKAQVEAIRVAAKSGEDTGDRPNAVTTMAEAVEAASSAYPELIFLDEARESARRTSRSNVRKALDALLAIGDVARKWQRGDLPGGFEGEFAQMPFEYKADISDTAKQAKKAAYVRRMPDGREVLLGPHIVVGNRTQVLRIYMYLDRGTRTVVIGHVGEHLPDKSTK